MNVLEHISFAVGIIAVAIIVWGVILGLIETLKNEFRRFRSKDREITTLHQIRYIVGSYLLLGLEFLIAADIMRTVVRPTLEELAILGGIVIIRTIIISTISPTDSGSDKRGRNGRRTVVTDAREHRHGALGSGDSGRLRDRTRSADAERRPP